MPVISRNDIDILSIATRPDCIDDNILSLLSELASIKPVWIELGLQTIHENTADYIRRGYSLDTNGAFKALDLNEYTAIVGQIIARLPKDMVIHRITGDGPKSLLEAPMWSANKKLVLNTLNQYFKDNNIYQGRNYT